MEEVIQMPQEKKNTLLVTCSGASNTGTIADCVARKLVSTGNNRSMLCLPALALGREMSLKKVREIDHIITIDGCQTSCAATLVEQKGGRKPDLQIQIARDFGIKKSMENLICDEDQVRRVAETLEKKIQEW